MTPERSFCRRQRGASSCQAVAADVTFRTTGHHLVSRRTPEWHRRMGTPARFLDQRLLVDRSVTTELGRPRRESDCHDCNLVTMKVL
jgi:hypothetical protein